MADETLSIEVNIEPNIALDKLKDLEEEYEKLIKAIQDSTDKIEKKQGKSIWERFALTRGMADFGAKRMQATGRRFQIPTGAGVVRAGLSMAERRGDTKAIGMAVYGSTKILSSISPSFAKMMARGAAVGLTGAGVAGSFMAGPATIEGMGPQVMAMLEGAVGGGGKLPKAWEELKGFVNEMAAELSALSAEIKAPFKAGADVMGIAKAALRLGGEPAAMDMDMRFGEFSVLSKFHLDNLKYMRAVESQKEVQYAMLYGKVMGSIGAKMKSW